MPVRDLVTGKTRSHNTPEKRNAAMRSWNSKNRERVREQGRARYAANPEYRARKKAEKLKYAYGITPEDVERMWDQQGGLCPCCGVALIRTGTREQNFHIDHCHATGSVRGLLHPKCNVGLGLFGDNPAALRGAAEYLERHRVK